jgi:AraC-like DNA-binding protein
MSLPAVRDLSSTSDLPVLSVDYSDVQHRTYWNGLNEVGDWFETKNISARMESFIFEPGIIFNFSDIQTKQPFQMECRDVDGTLGFGCCVCGEMFVDMFNNNKITKIQQGQMAVFSSPHYEKFTDLCQAGRLTRFSISIKKSCLDKLNEIYSGFFSSKFVYPTLNTFLNIYKQPLHINNSVRDIFNCSYIGPLRQIYMEGKALELLAHCWQGFMGESRPNEGLCVCRCDLEKAEHAAELLVNDFESVPSLEVLAKTVGLSRSKLNQVFQSVHGATPFAYLRSKRLEKAKDMLLQDKVNVTEAALAVGYSSLSHFTKAFTNQFNLHPSQCRKRNSHFSAQPLQSTSAKP